MMNMFRFVALAAQPVRKTRWQLFVDEELHSAASTGWFTCAEA
jgi:hypothetical protein